MCVVPTAASARHEAKLATHRAAVLEAGAGGLPFTKVPLVFETTGAMGKETQNWWEGIRQLRREAHEGSGPTSRRETGMDWTWTANHFQHLLATVDFCGTRTYASRICHPVDRDLPRGLNGRLAPYCNMLRMWLIHLPWSSLFDCCD